MELRRPHASEVVGGMIQRPSATTGRIAFLLQDLAGGGAERTMLTLAGAFADRGYDVDLLLVRAEGPYLSDLPDAVRVITLGPRRTAQIIPALIRYLWRQRPQVLVSALVNVNLAAILATRLSGRKLRVIVTEHNQIDRNAVLQRSPIMRLAYRSVPYIYPMADDLVAVSNGVATSLTKFSGIAADRIRVIYNPVVTPTLHRQARAAVPHPWFAPGQPPVILGVGRLTIQKDFANLMRAFAAVRRDRPAKLLILGEGSERERLQRLSGELGLQEDVHLPGFVENPYAFMARAAMFVLSSAWEGLPTVLIEAMACGTEVVATDCPSGPAEILGDGRYGEMVPVADPAALAAAILRTFDKPRATTALRHRADEFSIERSVDRYVDLAFGTAAVPIEVAAR